ncbi:BMC domain-containing protein [Pseudobutyrivibrio sp. ACV-2]|uniref:BMC domain-containing protein n=1 Tax=Pseudobutyrivibrio sp. ACV-2 TaxID=1520801 RepID=UPI00089B90A7|nr:BMC domain-containing protein [Pseudobutyrivibrio sp. ACV-2]SEA83486.1 BMC domain-containing protein [Pseudobutyrivibrio sp. ACV-2]
MQEALGLVETVGISTAIEVADVMVKAANVKVLELENSRGSGYMTVKIVGDVGAVKAAVDAAKAAGIKYGNFVSASVIARPANGMAAVFCNPEVPYQRSNGYNDVFPKEVGKKVEPKTEVKPKAEEKPKPKAEAETEVKPEVKSEATEKVEQEVEQKVETKPETPQEPPKTEASKKEAPAKSSTKTDSTKKTGTTKTSKKKGTK